MIYKEFLVAMMQLSLRNPAQIVIGENVIFIKPTKKSNRWTLSTQVFNAEDTDSSHVFSCLSSRSFFSWQTRGPYLQVDPISQGICLIGEMSMPPGKFIPFKQQITAFAALADEWKNTLCEIA